MESNKHKHKVYYNEIMARKYGALTAAVFNFLYCKIKSKEKNGKNFLDGEYWDCKTLSQIGFELGLSKRSVRTQIDNLRTFEIIKTRNYNETETYKCLWFALDDISAIENYLSDENINYVYRDDVRECKFNQAIMLKTLICKMDDEETDEIRITRKKLSDVSGFENDGFVKRSLIKLEKLNKIEIIASNPLIISMKLEHQV